MVCTMNTLQIGRSPYNQCHTVIFHGHNKIGFNEIILNYDHSQTYEHILSQYDQFRPGIRHTSN